MPRAVPWLFRDGELNNDFCFPSYKQCPCFTATEKDVGDEKFMQLKIIRGAQTTLAVKG